MKTPPVSLACSFVSPPAVTDKQPSSMGLSMFGYAIALMSECQRARVVNGLPCYGFPVFGSGPYSLGSGFGRASSNLVVDGVYFSFFSLVTGNLLRGDRG
ncbi:hypothetical protein LZ32DRAFT_598547 [Colletotrichum eremochloae]|nr:hypothetical protein LZ32DRAFT_598547 [Colletotrichum eremochloae]